MTEAVPARETLLPRSVPALLAFVAGYVDLYTYLALFGLFVAQVTGSFVTAGAELVTHDAGIAGKLFAIAAFVVAAALTAALIRLMRAAQRPVLTWMLALETVLLATFTALILLGPPIESAANWHGIVAGVFGAMAMGTQSVAVRLLMRGIPQTNVMTGNMTQIGIDTAELFFSWRHYARDRGNEIAREELAAARGRLATVLSIAIGFVLGAVVGAVSYAHSGLAGAPLAVIIVGALTVWALLRERVM
jgi:uncharacterized membrane protein YoaK (UPF0700 family)